MRAQQDKESRQDGRLTGVIPIIPTPFTPVTEEIDVPALRTLVEFAVAQRVAAICLPAYASEFYKLTETERHLVVEMAVEQSRGRTMVIAQSNHPAARVAAKMARRNVELGAEMVSIALPRLFPLGEADLERYARTVCDAVDVPVLIQDVNPGGPTITAEFCARLRAACPNFAYVKLEEPLVGAKVRAIREATGDRVGVLEGWGGMYALELLPAGICGLMPSLGVADLLAAVWRLGTNDRIDDAVEIFQVILPQIAFALQNMELFHVVEKRLLVSRGILEHATVRSASLSLSPELTAYADFLNQRVLQALSLVGSSRPSDGQPIQAPSRW
jgi:dihydrodipicolinate synthase/N-acetylneuraminate lyase